jgi:hypothetical protein
MIAALTLGILINAYVLFTLLDEEEKRREQQRIWRETHRRRK